MSESLKIDNVTVLSATRKVVDCVSIDVPQGKVVALLGPNGAGKSELVLGVAGALHFESGTVSIGGKVVSGRGMEFIRAAGVSAVPEGHQILTRLSVHDNLLAAGPMLSQQELNTEVEKSYMIFPELRKLAVQKAGSLSGGQQQMVALAQALVSRPKYLLLDEMSLGLAPVVIERLLGVVLNLREHGIGILLIEQFTQLALDIADHCYVISQGKIRFSGSPVDLKSNRNILESAYLGG